MASGDITPQSTIREFDTSNGVDIAVSTFDTSHIFLTYAGASNKGKAQMFECNSPVHTMTAVGTGVEYDSADGFQNKNILITSSKAINIWRTNTPYTGKAQVFDIDGSYNVTTAGTLAAFASSINTSSLHRMGLAQILSYTFVAVYQDNAGAVKASVLLVNNSTWATTRVGSEQTIAATGGAGAGLTVQTVDSNHIIIWYQKSDNRGACQVFSVNVGTGAIAPVGTEILFHNSTSGMYYPASEDLGSDKFVCWWFSGVTNAAKGRVFSVNPVTYAVTFAGAEYNVNTAGTGGYNLETVLHDTLRVALMWRTNTSAGKMQTYKINAVTYAITPDSSLSPIDVDTLATRGGLTKLKDEYITAGWSGPSTDGMTRAYKIDPTTPVATDFLPQII